jgi:Protein of unknown function (DUF2510)
MIVGLFLNWSKGDFAETGFEGFTRLDIVMVVLAVIAATLAIVDLFVPWRGLLPLAGMFGLYCLGATMFVPIEVSFSDLGPGWYVAMIFSFALGGAGMLAVVESLLPAPASAGGARPPEVPSARTGAPSPPPGWYADPWGQASQRFWSGSEWTERTQD